MHLIEFPYRMAYNPSHQQNNISHSPLHPVSNIYCSYLTKNHEQLKRKNHTNVCKKWIQNVRFSIL